MIYGNLGESLLILNKCINLDPSNPEHRKDYDDIQKKIYDYEKMEEDFNKKEFTRAEEYAEKLLKECCEFTALKIYYIKILIEKVKLTEVIKFIMHSINHDEKNEEIEYYLALAFYYDGQ